MTTKTSLDTQLNDLENLRLPELQACYKQVVGKATRAPNRKFLIRKIREAAAAQQGATESPAKAEPSPEAKAKAKAKAPKKPAARKAKAKAKTAPAKPRAQQATESPAEAESKAAPAKKAKPAAPPAPEPTILTGPLGPVTVATHPPKTRTQKAKKAPLRVAQPAPEPEPATDEPTTTDEPESTTAPPRPDLKALSVDDLRTAYVEEVGRPTKSTDRNYLIWKIGQARKGKVPVGPVSRTRSAAAGERRVLPLRMHDDTIAALDDVWRRHSLSSRMDMFRCALHQYLTSLDEHEAAALVRR